jgi:UDP-glucose 4-epimerase
MLICKNYFKMKILVTGGAGYIGSHTVRKLLKEKYEAVIFDNLSRGHIESVPDSVPFENVDLREIDELRIAFRKYKIDAIIHFAAFSYVGESVENPELYYENNVIGSSNLINVAVENGIKYFVFSSTCSVYGNPEIIPIPETHPTNPINPYAETKLKIEKLLDESDKSEGMKYIALRYFNAAGDSDDSSIGESHNPEPHIIPRVLFSALGKLEKLQIYGNDYPTKDGTCIRDYIHVNDLADAHIKALEYLVMENKSDVFNIGTGEGYSVNEIIEKAKLISGVDIKTEYTERRPGDPAVLVADNQKAKAILNWIPKYDLNKIIKTAWKWHKNTKF